MLLAQTGIAGASVGTIGYQSGPGAVKFGTARLHIGQSMTEPGIVDDQSGFCASEYEKPRPRSGR